MAEDVNGTFKTGREKSRRNRKPPKPSPPILPSRVRAKEGAQGWQPLRVVSGDELVRWGPRLNRSQVGEFSCQCVDCRV